jgi:protein-arginine kinase activator protein McsA
MDERVEDFLADVLALEGEEVNAIREVVRGTLADHEQLSWAQEVNKRMKEKAVHACHAPYAVLALLRRYGCRTLKASSQRHALVPN